MENEQEDRSGQTAALPALLPPDMSGDLGVESIDLTIEDDWEIVQPSPVPEQHDLRPNTGAESLGGEYVDLTADDSEEMVQASAAHEPSNLQGGHSENSVSAERWRRSLSCHPTDRPMLTCLAVRATLPVTRRANLAFATVQLSCMDLAVGSITSSTPPATM